MRLEDVLLRSVVFACAGLASVSAGCSRPFAHSAVEIAMTSAYRPTSDAPLLGANAIGIAPDVVLAGDMHCHVSPPDHPVEASRDPAATVDLARAEGLDFLVLTPHVPALFFQDEGMRAAVVEEQASLRRALAARSDGHTTFVVGMEYTDHAYGHVGVSFADMGSVLADLPVEEARSHPGRFFDQVVAKGGVLVINHPLSVPLDSSVSMARADLSWRGFLYDGAAGRASAPYAPNRFLHDGAAGRASAPYAPNPSTTADQVPEEIGAVTRLAQGVEAYNMVVTHLRDRYLLRDTPRTLLATLALIDGQILAQQRRIAPVGGSDSHVGYLRATTFVRARDRSEHAIRDALVAGRTCVRAPEACSFEARAPGGTWQTVGGTLPASETLEARAPAGTLEVLVNGASVISAEPGEVVRVPLSARGCNVVRARVGEGFSAPIYVGCSF